MIELTLTFVLQVFHFSVAYMLVRYLFMQPALAVLADREREKLALKKSIMVARKQVGYQKQVKQQHQVACQQTFSQALLQVQALEQEQRVTHPHMTGPAPIVVDQESMQLQKDQAAAWITKEAEHHD